MKKAKVRFVTPADESRVGVLIHYKNGKRVVSRVVVRASLLLSSRVRMYWDQPSGDSKNPVTLRDNTNEGGGPMMGSPIVSQGPQITCQII